MLHTRSPKRFDSNFSVTEDALPSAPGGPSAPTPSPLFLAADDEISQLKQRNAQLQQENETLKQSILLLSSRLAKQLGRRTTADAFILPPAPTPMLPPPTPQSATLLPPPTSAAAASLPSSSSVVVVPVLIKRNSSREAAVPTPPLPPPVRAVIDDPPPPSSSLPAATAISCRATLTGHDSAVYSCKYMDNLVCSTSLDRTVRIWREGGGGDDASSWSQCVLGSHGQSGTDVHFLANKTSVVSSSMDMFVRVWDMSQSSASSSSSTATTTNPPPPPPPPIFASVCEGIPLCLSVLDANSFVSGTNVGAVHVFDVRTPAGPVMQARQDAPGAINALCSGDFGILSGDSRGVLRHWDLRQSLACSDVFDSSAAPPTPTSGGGGGGAGFGGSANGSTKKQSSSSSTAATAAAAICGMSICSADRLLAIYSHDNCVRIYQKQDAGGLKLVQCLRGAGRSRDWPVRCAFSKPMSSSSEGNGDVDCLLATGSLTRQAFVFAAGGHITTPRPSPPSTTTTSTGYEEMSMVQSLDGHTGGVYECDFSTDNSSIVTCSADSTLKIWS